MNPLRHAWHLMTRFFGVLAGTRLGPIAQDEVNSVLDGEAAALFWDQNPIDQRHAYEVAQRVRKDYGDDQTVIVAALLHDVGKRHTDAGVIGRSIATVLDVAKLPMAANWRRYRNHGPLGAADLEAIGASTLAVAFARGEQVGEERVDQRAWEALVAADDA